MKICTVKTKKKKPPSIDLSVYNKLIRLARQGYSADEVFRQFEYLLTYKKLRLFTFIMVTKDHQLDKVLTAVDKFVNNNGSIIGYKQRNIMLLRGLCYHFQK